MVSGENRIACAVPLAKKLAAPPHEQAQANAEQEHSRNGRIETKAGSFNGNIAWQTAKPAQLVCGEPHDKPDDNQDNTHSKKNFSEVFHAAFPTVSSHGDGSV
jgi:hypothetical protein